MLWPSLRVLWLFAYCAPPVCVLPGRRPAALDEPRVVVNELHLQSEQFAVADGMSYIRGISPLCGDAAQYAVFEESVSVWLLDARTRRFTRALRFPRRCLRVTAIDLDADERCEFACGGGGFTGVGVIDDDGTLVWQIEGSYSINVTAHAMAVGDLDRNGVLECYVVSTAGVARLRPNGTPVWQVPLKPNRLGYTEVAVTPSSSREDYVVVTTAGAPIALLDPESGGIVRTVGQPLTWTRLDVVPWPPNGRGFRIIARTPRQVQAFDESGKPVLTYPIPSELGSGYSLTALSARLGQGSCLVTLLGTRSFWRRSVLVVFDHSGRVVYQRILRDTGGLAVFPPGAGRGRAAQGILVGDGPGRLLLIRWPEGPDTGREG